MEAGEFAQITPSQMSSGSPVIVPCKLQGVRGYFDVFLIPSEGVKEGVTCLRGVPGCFIMRKCLARCCCAQRDETYRRAGHDPHDAQYVERERCLARRSVA